MKLHGQDITEKELLVKYPDHEAIRQLWSLTIHKPEHDTTVAIRDKIIEKAIKEGVMLEVITQGAKELIEPKLWKKEAKLIYRYFKNPNEPMKLYERKVGQGGTKWDKMDNQPNN